MSAENDTVSSNDDFGLATWNRPRSTEELRSFVNRKHALIPDFVDVDN